MVVFCRVQFGLCQVARSERGFVVVSSLRLSQAIDCLIIFSLRGLQIMARCCSALGRTLLLYGRKRTGRIRFWRCVVIRFVGRCGCGGFVGVGVAGGPAGEGVGAAAGVAEEEDAAVGRVAVVVVDAPTVVPGFKPLVPHIGVIDAVDRAAAELTVIDEDPAAGAGVPPTAS